MNLLTHLYKLYSYVIVKINEIPWQLHSCICLHMVNVYTVGYCYLF